MVLKYKQTKKSRLWNLVNRLKPFHFIHQSRYVNIPKEWASELKFGKHVLVTLDLTNQQIILSVPREDIEIPEKGAGWIDE